MKMSRSFVFALAALLPSMAVPAYAQAPEWLTRCRLQLADDAKPESGKYLFETRGKTAGAEGRGSLDYNSGISARAAVYPTDARDVLNPYSTLSFSVSYVTPGDGKSKPAVGAVSFRAIGKDFNAIPGAPVTMKLVIDGAAFGPYEPRPVSSGMYSLWLDTAETDGDSKPPLLDPVAFGKLARAVDAMKTLDLVLVREGADLVRASVPTPQLTTWRDGLAAWSAKTIPGVGEATYCASGDVVH